MHSNRAAQRRKDGKSEIEEDKRKLLLREIVLNAFFDTCFVFLLQVFKSWCKSRGQRRQTERPIRTAPHLVWRDTEKFDPRAPLLPLTSQCLTSSTSSSSSRSFFLFIQSFHHTFVRSFFFSFFPCSFLSFLDSFHPLNLFSHLLLSSFVHLLVCLFLPIPIFFLFMLSFFLSLFLHHLIH